MFQFIDLAEIAAGLVVGGVAKTIHTAVIARRTARHRPIVQQIIISMAADPKDWAYIRETNHCHAHLKNINLEIMIAYGDVNTNKSRSLPYTIMCPSLTRLSKKESQAIQEAFEKSRSEIIDENLIKDS